MDNLIDISFIIPCHNLENYIIPLLHSFQILNLKDITSEFIFILDDCTDKTEDIIKDYMSNFNLHILKCCHHSCGLARNEGLEIAQGKYIWFLDGDDWLIYPNVLQDVLPVMEQNNMQIIQIKFVSNFFDREYFSMVWQYIYTKEFIGDTRFTPIQPNEDVKFNKTLFTNNNIDKIPLYTIPTYYYNYDRPGSNMEQYKRTHEIKP